MIERHALWADDAPRSRSLVLADGTGNFTEVDNAGGAGGAGSRTTDLKLADMDGDGDLDLVLANWLQPNRVMLNNGAGVFADRSTFYLNPLRSPR